MKNYNKRFESIFLMYLDPKNFHGWGMQKVCDHHDYFYVEMPEKVTKY